MDMLCLYWRKVRRPLTFQTHTKRIKQNKILYIYVYIYIMNIEKRNEQKKKSQEKKRQEKEKKWTEKKRQEKKESSTKDSQNFQPPRSSRYPPKLHCSPPWNGFFGQRFQHGTESSVPNHFPCRFTRWMSIPSVANLQIQVHDLYISSISKFIPII